MVGGALEKDFWHGRRVFVTGHTGFKGSWLALMLSRLGAAVSGYALDPPSQPNLFALAEIGGTLRDTRGDVRDPVALRAAMTEARPEIIIHMAAQSLVRTGYDDPIGTFGVNVMGTAHVLEAARHVGGVRTVVIVTTDKCYDNQEWVWGYRETDRLGGRDPYASSKACAELVTAAYRDSYFSSVKIDPVAIVSARAGNVVGGGDFAADRIVPDAVRACVAGRVLRVRNPNAVRPWQHVLDPLHGYLLLAEHACRLPGLFAQAWNFGPDHAQHRNVRAVVERFFSLWDNTAAWDEAAATQQHEAHLLSLDATKARVELGWRPRLDFDAMMAWTVEWYQAYAAGDRLLPVTLAQIDRYLAGMHSHPRP